MAVRKDTGILFNIDSQAPTERSIKHIRELIKAKKAGYHAILAFVIQMDGVREVRPSIGTHPEFGEAMEDAKKVGVEVWFLTCRVEPDSLDRARPTAGIAEGQELFSYARKLFAKDRSFVFLF